jgi:hypothetical protein
MDEDSTPKSRLTKRVIIITVLVVFILWAGIGVAAYALLDDWQSRGTLGDMFGVVNALFSGLALAGIVIAILLQSEELALQRQELKDTRKELKRSAEAQEDSAKLLRRQLDAQVLPSLTFRDVEFRPIQIGGRKKQGVFARMRVSQHDMFYPVLRIIQPGGIDGVVEGSPQVLHDGSDSNVLLECGDTARVIDFVIGFTDIVGQQRSQRFRYNPTPHHQITRLIELNSGE